MTNKNQEFISVRVEPELKKALRKKARKEQRSLSSYLRLLFIRVVGKRYDF